MLKKKPLLLCTSGKASGQYVTDKKKTPGGVRFDKKRKRVRSQRQAIKVIVNPV